VIAFAWIVGERQKSVVTAVSLQGHFWCGLSEEKKDLLMTFQNEVERLEYGDYDGHVLVIEDSRLTSLCGAS
jgi:hypothetical protein